MEGSGFGPAAHFREAGTGLGVVCVHSSASSSGQWRPLMDRLSDRFRVIAVDLYGYGKSPAWPEGREMYLDDEVSLLEPVFRSAGDAFHLVGHSYGGAVALKAALKDPRRLQFLVLYEPVLFSVLVADDPNGAAAREILAVRDDTGTRGDPRRPGGRGGAVRRLLARSRQLRGHTGGPPPGPGEQHAQGEGGVARRLPRARAVDGVLRGRRSDPIFDRLGVSGFDEARRQAAVRGLAAGDRYGDRRRRAHGSGNASRKGQRSDRELPARSDMISDCAAWQDEAGAAYARKEQPPVR